MRQCWCCYVILIVFWDYSIIISFSLSFLFSKPFHGTFFFIVKSLLHIVYFDYAFPLPKRSQILPTILPTPILGVSVSLSFCLSVSNKPTTHIEMETGTHKEKTNKTECLNKTKWAKKVYKKYCSWYHSCSWHGAYPDVVNILSKTPLDRSSFPFSSKYQLL